MRRGRVWSGLWPAGLTAWMLTAAIASAQPARPATPPAPAIPAAPRGPAAPASPPPATARQPQYLPYAEFVAEASQAEIALKQAYNAAVLRYNEALYDYHVTIEQHDQLVDTYNGSSDPDERRRAREQATPLRARLQTLRREVTNRAAGVDQAARRAAAAGVSVRP